MEPGLGCGRKIFEFPNKTDTTSASSGDVLDSKYQGIEDVTNIRSGPQLSLAYGLWSGLQNNKPC